MMQHGGPEICQHGRDLWKCATCAPDWMAGRALAHAIAETLARFGVNLARVRMIEPGR